MAEPKKEGVLLTIEGPIATLTVNRPERFNALDTELLLSMDHLLDELEEHKEVRVLLITGAGEKSFVSGADIRDLRQMTPSTAKRSIEVGHKVFTRIEHLSVPSIAVINGHCLGGGLELAMACDIRIIAKNAKIGLTEANVGMIPGWGGTMRLPRIVGLGRAKEMILLGRMLDADTAKSYGLVSEVLEDADSLRKEAEKMAEKLASLPPHIMALDKRLIADAHGAEPGYCATQDALALAYCFTTKDSIEGLDAFIEKRPAQFIGE